MKIRVFEAGKGDCLLLTSACDNHRILVDGGLVDTFGHDAYSANVAPRLGELRDQKKQLDLVCVSHIDQDHIGGILRMLNDEFAWRVFRFQEEQGLAPEEPDNDRPPEIAEIWHNAFHTQVAENQQEIGDAIAAAATESVMLGTAVPTAHNNNFLGGLATSMSEAAKLSRRISADQLGIGLNTRFNRKLVMANKNSQNIAVGGLNVSVIGPTRSQLSDLRAKWNKWLESEKGKRQIASLERKSASDEDKLTTGDLQGFLAASLGPTLGDRETVTEENVSSIVMLVEEGDQNILLTGDARDDDILTALIEADRTTDEHVHLNVLKLQHHGSKNNFGADFARHVTADHYILSGNGHHGNPTIPVLETLVNSRLGTKKQKSPNAQTADKFKVWFSADEHSEDADSEHMREVEAFMTQRAQESDGQMLVRFNRNRSFEFTPKRP